mmetsp:Transcript_39278/g.77253  ORF Transcript_39278/g.77253 Transcript_39278/m.77253 type:complete len:208 (+) Transcript_39278:739-1362(+)
MEVRRQNADRGLERGIGKRSLRNDRFKVRHDAKLEHRRFVQGFGFFLFLATSVALGSLRHRNSDRGRSRSRKRIFVRRDVTERCHRCGRFVIGRGVPRNSTRGWRCVELANILVTFVLGVELGSIKLLVIKLAVPGLVFDSVEGKEFVVRVQEWGCGWDIDSPRNQFKTGKIKLRKHPEFHVRGSNGQKLESAGSNSVAGSHLASLV